MARKKFTQLTVATEFNDADIIAIVQSGQSKQASGALLKMSVGSPLVLWDFDANGGDWPTDPSKLYISIDGTVVPENTWFVAITDTPTGAADFYTK